VFSSIHARLHTSQARVLKILGRLNRWHLNEEKTEMAKELGVTRADFERNTDVVPVSDPHIFAESQRYAQVQALAARAQANPDLYNRLAVEKRILKQIKLPDINEVLPDPQDIQDMNPALENVAMTLGKPAGAFPAQDHLAHMQVHLDYAKDPMYGANPIIAPTFLPGFIEHMKQHLTLWYLNQMDSHASASLERPFNILKVEPIMRDAQRLLAVASQHVFLDVQQGQFAQVGPIIQQAVQMMQQLKSQMQPTDPSVQALVQTQMAETQRKSGYDQARLQLDAAKLQADTQAKQEKNVADQQIKAAEITQNVSVLTLEQQHEMQRQQLAAQQQQQMAAQQAAQQQAAQQQAMQSSQPVLPTQGV
jgi:hypothetical protein